MAKKIKFAPKEIFEKMLEYMVIPTFDLFIEYGQEGIIVVKRKIAPYKGAWSLPGLRMHKGEDVDDTLSRIAKQEIGIKVNLKKKVLIGQFVGKFKTEHSRQDISTAYLVPVSSNQKITINREHFYSYRITKTIPPGMGAMYKHFFKEYLKLR